MNGDCYPSRLPGKAQILVIGGGPSGSYTATVLAREGFDVVLLEATKFPRYHVGESMVPSCRSFLKFVDLDETIKNYGFCKKPGAAFKLAVEKREAYTDFIKHGPDNGSWNVIRSEFDDILLKNATKSGVHVFEETKVVALNFVNDDHERPVSAVWQSVTNRETTGTLTFDYLVDATGRSGLMSPKYLKNRRFNQSLKNVASWGYWKGTGSYAPNTSRHNAAWFEALTDQSGWNWFIPLHNGMTSVGVVMNQDASTARKEAAKIANGGVALTAKEHYLECLKLSPELTKLIGNGTLVSDGPYSTIQHASDYSYNATTYSGDHYRIIGDAAAFIDPFFSSGVHLAFTGALAAAASIASSIRGEFDEEECCRYHNEKIGMAYTRFLIIVLSAYKQMRTQAKPILSDVDEDNFDRVFELIRPVIQGHVDVGKRITEDELQKMLDFCGNVFLPVDAKMQESVAARMDSKLFAPDAAVMMPDEIDQMVGLADLEAQQVLKKLNARNALVPDWRQPATSLVTWSDEVAGGFVVRTQMGRLGLVRAQ